MMRSAARRQPRSSITACPVSSRTSARTPIAANPRATLEREEHVALGEERDQRRAAHAPREREVEERHVPDRALRLALEPAVVVEQLLDRQRPGEERALHRLDRRAAARQQAVQLREEPRAAKRQHERRREQSLRRNRREQHRRRRGLALEVLHDDHRAHRVPHEHGRRVERVDRLAEVVHVVGDARPRERLAARARAVPAQAHRVGGKAVRGEMRHEVLGPRPRGGVRAVHEQHRRPR